MAEQVNIAYVFPGQGVQWIGMGRDLYDNLNSPKTETCENNSQVA